MQCLIEEARRVREDAAVQKDVLGRYGKGTPILALTARLDRPGDPVLKKALARIKRKIGR